MPCIHPDAQQEGTKLANLLQIPHSATRPVRKAPSRVAYKVLWERACRSGALVDMLGAVWQWCWDWYAPYGGGTDPAGPEAGTLRVVRGGSSGDTARVARRYAVTPDTRHPEIAFRVCRTLPPGA